MQQAAERFRSISQSFLEASYRLFPQWASELGLEEFENQLGPNSPDTHRSYAKLLRSTLAEVEALPASAFAGDDWLDRRGFLSLLRTGLFENETRELWRINPQTHCDAALNCLLNPVIRRPDDLRGLLPSLERRMERIPAFLAEGARCIEKPVPLWTKLAVQSCQGAPAFLDSLERQLLPISPEPAKTTERLAAVRKAFERYARAVAAKKLGKPGSFAVGRENFEFLIRERLGLAWSLPEAEAVGRCLIDRFRHELTEEAARLGGDADTILARARADWNPGPLLPAYERSTRETKEAFLKADLLTMPAAESLNVMPVPEFLRHLFPTAAYLAPGPFAKSQVGIFWVNDLGAHERDEQKRLAETRQHFGIELTCAHEAYPGHHVQFVLQNAHRSRLRPLFAHSIYYEGWTLWVEKMCIDFGIHSAPHARLVQLQDALWRACRIVIDCGLHSGSLSLAGAARILQETVGFTRRRAEGEIHWYTSAPTIPMSYLLGRLEVEKLHAKLTSENGWSTKQFNDWLLGFGALPWSWIWQSTLESPAPLE